MSSINLKLDKMRKEDSFSIYPVAKGDNTVIIQSDSRIGEFNLETGIGVLSPRIAGGAYFMHLAKFMGAKSYQMTVADMNAIKTKLVAAGSTMVVGMGAMTADNSGGSTIVLI